MLCNKNLIKLTNFKKQNFSYTKIIIKISEKNRIFKQKKKIILKNLKIKKSIKIISKNKQK